MEVDQREQDADRAAGRGDMTNAERLLSAVVVSTPNRIDTWLKLGAIRRARGDIDGALSAVSGALRVDPLHFMALMSRARLLEAQGRPREAARFYLRGLAQLPDQASPPPGLAGLIDHARKAGEAYRDDIAAQRDALVSDDPSFTPIVQRRMARFTSNALRRTRVYHSEPTHYHYPGLVEREFHGGDEFTWLKALEAQTEAIRDEFLALQRDGTGRAEPYVQYSDELPLRQWAALNHSEDWTAFHLIKGGQIVQENAARCPRTMAVLAGIDQPVVRGRSPNAMFSVLKPQTAIPPHTGVANTRLVCHLPLIVPPGCWFRVGAERREWTPGKAFVFDDTIEHEAANESDLPRVVFIIDIWHPGLDPAERAGVARLMEADDAENGAAL